MSFATLRASDGTVRPNRALRITLWIVQILLLVAFGMLGFTKLTQSTASLAEMLPWTANVPPALVRFIGLAEVLGSLGLVLPSATRIKPQLTVLAALGLVTIMALAAGFHLTRGETALITQPVVLGALAAFVAWGRSRRAPIAPRA